MDPQEESDLNMRVGRMIFGNRFGDLEEDQRLEVVPHYATNMQYAHRVVEQMGRNGWLFKSAPFHPGQQWSAEFRRTDRQNNLIIGQAIDDTEPLAICKAALEAIKNGPTG
jgi:Phage ABA sandwich domain